MDRRSTSLAVYGLRVQEEYVRKDAVMSRRSKQSYGLALVLVVLGVLALYGGPPGLALLIPAAILVRYAVSEPALRGGRD